MHQKETHREREKKRQPVVVESSPMDLQLRLLGYDNDIEAILFMKIVNCKGQPHG